ncbi:LysR family transcriptional regulator [Pelomicrobium methylotrophicum]|uniref:LysR family transcriptional regulator n=1 Tax=Pelomicrobium methylotrophicum TaxID=2602750 RepID=A0A5C7EJV2_9PROT|nr:LysR family transcriptional regulator [Pelomicrobium methylotrophicum]TXF11277.1 LysR family transcriptional regulator [Pelomicrobium methylotrophicum]
MADRRLQVFYTVAKQLSFTKAAELLFMTQPAVTFQVKQLEEHFNTRLFERSHGKISLTPAGQLVFEYAERILNLSSELETRMHEMVGGIAGPLSIGASTTIAEFMIPRILGEFKSAYPQVQLRLVVGNSEMIENQVADHMLDLGLIESPPHLPSLKNEILCEDELVMICAPDHPLAQASSVVPKQLAQLPYVSREPGSGTREFADQFFAKQGVSPDEMNIVMELGSPEAVKGVVETGLGFGVVSRYTVQKELKLGTLVAVPFRPKLVRIMSLVCPKEKFRSRLLSTFIDFAVTRLAAPKVKT